MMADKVNIPAKFDSFSDHWAPRIVARYNDNEVRLVKVEGEFSTPTPTNCSWCSTARSRWSCAIAP
jgi:hypothetical protein